MKITVKNFAKYNPRDDVKNPTWVRLERNWWQDSAMFRLTSDAKVVWFVIIGMATLPNGEADIDPLFLARVLSIEEITVNHALDDLADLGRIEFEETAIESSHSRARENAPVFSRARESSCATGRDGTDVTGRDGTLSPVDPADLAVGTDWLAFALSQTPWRAGKAGMTAEAFAAGVAKVKRATDLNDEGMVAILAFVKADDFWRQNALSPGGLLKKNADGVRKVDNILLRMKGSQSREQRIIEATKAWAES